MKRKSNKGFTMAEMLAVVALVLILSAVAVVGVAQYRRSMRQLEYDAIAKEIFIAAQNHLTMADNQGLVGAKTLGRQDPDNTDIYYFAYPGTSPDDETAALSLMLPFGAVDETVRAGGSYVVVYQKSSALVLDVFYSDPDDQTGLLGGLGCTFKDITDEEYTALKGYRGDGQKDNRQHYPGKDNNNAVIGWYGGDEALRLEKPLTLAVPSIQIINAERLMVVCEFDSFSTPNAQLQLIVTEKGNTANRKAVELDLSSFDENGKGYYVLDSITDIGVKYTNNDEYKHFADLFEMITPGADIEIKAVAYSNSVLSNIAESVTLTTNSLFASLENDGTNETAIVSNIRHLENLDGKVSGFNSSRDETQAKQTSDLDWDDAWTVPNLTSPDTKEYWTDKTIVPHDGTGKGEKSFYPVDLDYVLSYNGQGHSISDVQISTTGPAGLLGKITVSGSKIENLELVDFSVKGTDAGALIGTTKDGNVSADVTVTNVVAHNSKEKDGETDDNTGELIHTITGSGSVGGLIGNLTGGTVSYSAAALIVHSDSGSAGGLIGSAAGGTVTGCYAGGHADETKNGTKYVGRDESERPQYTDFTGYVGYSADSAASYNVTGVTAGGLIGESAATVSYSYSTCSVFGTSVAGGFVGSVVDGGVDNCYCTGLVAPERNGDEIIDNAFLGSGSVTGSNQYYEIVNELVTFDASGNVKEIKYKGAGGNSATPFDLSFDPENNVNGPDVFNDFIGRTSDWAGAKPYNTQLGTYYADKYNLKSIERLMEQNWDGDEVKENYFVRTHYGDWPSPELFFVNESTASSS